MSAKQVQVKISFHKASGQYKKVIGKAFAREGSIQPKLFYLGEDEEKAVTKAMELKKAWEALLAPSV